MATPDDDLEAQRQLATATDRRRPGRQDVSPELIPILRGEFDHEAPADPALPPPQRRATREILIGAALAAALVILGVALRSAV